MTGVELITLGIDAADQRLDRWFKQHYPALSHGHLQKLLRSGQVRLDGKRVKGSARLETGQQLRVPPIGEAASAPQSSRQETPVSRKDAKELQERIIYKDNWLIAIDKPAGLAVQGGTGQSRHLDGMLEALRFGSDHVPKLVHRLDKDTSGLLLLARHGGAARLLTAAFREKKAQKIYWAAVAGAPPKPRGVISLALAKEGAPGQQKMKGSEDAKPAVTLYREVARRGRKVAQDLGGLSPSPLEGQGRDTDAAPGLYRVVVGLGQGKEPRFSPRAQGQQACLVARPNGDRHQDRRR